MDRICGIARDPLCRRRYDLARNERGLAVDTAIMIPAERQELRLCFAVLSPTCLLLLDTARIISDSEGSDP